MRKFLIAAALAVLPIAATAAPAQASIGSLILGEHQDLRGTTWAHQRSTGAIGAAEDKASSIFNDSDYAWLVFQDKNYKGRYYCIRSGQIVKNLHLSKWGFGDKISSAMILNRTHCVGQPTFE